MSKCNFCEGSLRQRLTSKNKAYQLRYGKKLHGTNLRRTQLMILQWAGKDCDYQLQGSFDINFYPMCGREFN